MMNVKSILTNRLWALAGLLILLIHFGWVLTQFHFQYTDMDQVLMWYGASEFGQGNFHTIRYFGQNYGTMLEALVSLVFVGIPLHMALPMASALIFSIPYLLIGKTGNEKLKWIWPVGFLLLFPPEYFMVAFMPRDFVTGVAVTSIALLFLRKKQWWSYLVIGWICIMGWSFQQNAALFGAAISVYAAFKDEKIHWRAVGWMALGYTIGGILHLLVDVYYSLHTELIVHQAWDFHYAWKQIWDGWKNLDRHFAWVTPALQYQGWFYVPLFASILGWTYYKRRWSLFTTTLVLGFITFFSLGVLKIHDARGNVFFSHERMFLALPVALLFILSRLEIKKLPHYLIPVGIILTTISLLRFDQIKQRNLDDKRDHVVHVNTTEGFYQDCDAIYALASKYDVDLFLLGPHYSRFTVISTHGCQAVHPEVKVLFPEYERKTWDMRETVSNGPTRFLWHNTGKVDIDHRMMDISKETGVEGLYLIELKAENPIDFYISKGYKVNNY